MPKQLGIVSALAIALILYLIWKDPSGTATIITGFAHSAGGFLGDSWDRFNEFFRKLIG